MLKRGKGGKKEGEAPRPEGEKEKKEKEKIDIHFPGGGGKERGVVHLLSRPGKKEKEGEIGGRT